MFGLTPLLWKLAGLAALLALIGGLGWYGLHQHDRRLSAESQLKTAVANAEIAKQVAKVDAKAAEDRYKANLAREHGRVVVKEVLREVKDAAVCDLPADVVRVYDARMQGDSTDDTPGHTGAATPPVAVSQSQSLAALDDMSERFHACRSQIMEIDRQIQARWPE